MSVIYLSDHRPLTEKQKVTAEVMLSNEINEVMADLEILEEELDKTSMFRGLSLRNAALSYLNQKVKHDQNGNVDEKTLQEVYRWYFSEKEGE